MTVVTPELVQRILRSGGFTDAQTRLHNGTALPKNKADWNMYSSWALICEEVLDTEHDPDWYDDILAELTRRGFNFGQIDRMRAFAWQTAGWLNYDRMLWEWITLNEDDMRIAIDYQLKDGIISPTEHAERMTCIEHPARILTVPLAKAP